MCDIKLYVKTYLGEKTEIILSIKNSFNGACIIMSDMVIT